MNEDENNAHIAITENKKKRKKKLIQSFEIEIKDVTHTAHTPRLNPISKW